MGSLALYSRYVINGVQQELTPAGILDAVCDARRDHIETAGVVVDELVDPAIGLHTFDAGRIREYLEKVEGVENPCVPPAFSEAYSRLRVATALVDTLWKAGHFTLEDLRPEAVWSWDFAPVGAAASFYQSVRSVAEYVDSLDLRLSSYSLSDGDDCRFSVELQQLPEGRICPAKADPDPQSWLVYVPFDPCDFRLGGSALARELGIGGGVAPQIGDADYFIDCFEVLRELVEDGVVIAGATVGDGGLLCALKKMCADTGISVDVSDIMKSYDEDNVVRVLFSEVPGALIQIKDLDFDYLDAQLLLQDVAFFPLGHPDSSVHDVLVRAGEKSGIQKILESLMQNAEGED